MMHADPNQPSLQSEERARAGEPLSGSIPKIPPGIAASQAAFYRALPELLKKHLRRWVAFHGDELIGFAKSQFDLYEECSQRGLADDTFVVRFIMDDMPLDIDCTPLVEV